MANSIDKLAKEIKNEILSSDERKPQPYDTQAEVVRVVNGTAWVHIPGGVEETPVRMTIDAKKGDMVNIHVEKGTAWITGNGTRPPTDDTRANVATNIAEGAEKTANIASNAAIRAQESAIEANTAAEEAKADAAIANTAATEAKSAATAANTAAQQAIEDASLAQTAAGNALTAAQNAQGSADAALLSLSNVEDVVGVLEWITAHGTMTANGSAALDPSKVYFIVDPNGDYVVGGIHYSIVSEPKAEDRTSYYTMSIDESVQNYVATHVVVDTEGLWLIPDAGGNKVLIATGAGSIYTTAGTYIIGKVNGVDTVFAKFTKNSATIGDESNSSLEMTTRTFNVRDKENSTFFEVADMRNDLGVGTVTETWTASGESAFILSVDAVNTNYTVTVNGTQASPTKTTSNFSFNSPPSSGSTIQATYTSASQLLKQYTSGLRADNSIKGLMSFAEGYNNTASGFCSHAEGKDTVARGLHSHAEGREAKANNLDSHAEGYNTRANGSYSHAEGYGSQANGMCAHAEGENAIANGHISHASGKGTVAGYSAQTVIGKYNSNQSGNAFEIGKGNTANQRSNAFEVSWGGSVNIASGAKYKIDGSALSASDVGALPISGGTMTGQLLTSYKTSVAMGSYGSSQTTVQNFIEEVRFSSGCCGSVNIGTAYTKNNVTINTGWYNFMYIPHRSGGVNGSASGDNCNYGNCFLFGMNNTNGRFVIRVSSSSIQEVAQLYSSIDRYTRSSAGTLDWSSTAEGDSKVIMKSALAFWNGAYSGTSSSLKYSANGEIIGTNTGLGKTTWTPTSGSSYSNYGGCYYEKYGRVVHVHVGVSGLTAGNATNIYTLPSGYRPSSPVYAHGTGGAWNNIGYLEISTAGVVTVRSAGNYCGADITYLA